MTEKIYEIVIETYDGQVKSLGKIKDKEQAEKTYQAYVEKLKSGDVPTSTSVVKLNQVEDNKYQFTLQGAFRPKTVKEIEDIMYRLAYVVVNGTAYRVLSAYGTDEDDREEEYNGGVPQPYLNVVEDEDDYGYGDDEDINLSELADRTDVEFLTLVHI